MRLAAGPQDFPASTAAIALDTDFPEPSLIYVGATGDVAVMPWIGSTAVVYKTVPDGAVLPVLVKRVNTTGTTVASPTTNLVRSS